MEDMVRLPRTMVNRLLALPRSYQDLAKDTMIMQDRAMCTMFYHDLGEDAKINHVLDQQSMVAIAFFW